MLKTTSAQKKFSYVLKLIVFASALSGTFLSAYAGIGYVLKWEFAPGVYYPYFFLNWGSPLGALGFGKELPYVFER